MSAVTQILGVLVLVLGVAGFAISAFAGNSVADARVLVSQQTKPEFQEQAQLIDTVLGFMGSAAVILQIMSAGNILAGIGLAAAGRQNGSKPKTASLTLNR